jgi:glycosyltransferase involved in cell wall biosynthesis
VHADVYLASGSGLSTGWAYDAARLLGSPFVFLAASDGDAMSSLPWLTKRRERWWYLRALRGADARVAQSESQQLLFRESFGLETHVIPNPVALADAPADVGRNRMVLWLSTYKRIKRPEWFLELARRLPDARFVMIGAPGAPEHAGSWDAVQAAARDIPNVEIHGYLEHDQIGEQFRRAAVFVHTSPLEGFPMTLLEAWSYGVPSVSCVDPGGVVARFGLGSVVSTLDELVDAVEALLAADERRVATGARAREYVARCHGPAATYEPFAELLDEVVTRRRG